MVGKHKFVEDLPIERGFACSRGGILFENLQKIKGGLVRQKKKTLEIFKTDGEKK